MSKETEMDKSRRGLRELYRWIDEHADSLGVSMWFELHNVACGISLDIDRALVEAKDMRDFCKRIEEAAERREDVTLFGADYVALPVDSDGMAIHVGDDMETLLVGHEGEHCEVECIMLTADGWEVDGDSPKSMFHHKSDTWERIIRDAIAEGMSREQNNRKAGCDRSKALSNESLVARCKALAKEEK